MTTLICIGLGYSAEQYVADFDDRFDRIVGTMRSKERAAVLNAYGGKPRAIVFDGKVVSDELKQAIVEADAALISVPQDEGGDPVLRVCGDAFLAAAHLRSIVYLSTVGVYGDSAGGWVDEDSPTKPESARAHERLAAEQAWQAFGRKRGVAVAILRLAGIYGPGRNALIQVARGQARRVVKRGQVFNRIHVGDIAQAIDAAIAHNANGIFNVADDEPTPPAEPIVFAAQLLGREPPPEVAFADAAPTMSPMALSFWQDCRRVRNDKLKRELGVTLRYPTYREGLRALLAEQARD
ncbi:MAG TPA: NAD-dependent epimerase/dehydratase family protein [Xanthobacteraceae bacterium]|jgi:nucleoside-diphosphate-sugar epimerase|nr:NAD-dependent epimerase/dehydratase family protein [Xanthobacteraceae bacterium]